MLEDLIVQPDDTTPIYQQIENQIRRFIRAGRLKPDQALPSVRVIANALAVNPMTVSKSINRLVEQKYLVHRRGKPTCVANPLPSSLTQIDNQLQSELQRVISHAQQLGLTAAEIKKLIEQLW